MAKVLAINVQNFVSLLKQLRPGAIIIIINLNGEWLDLEPDRGESEVEEGEREPAEEENGDHGDQKFARSKIAVAIYIVIVIVIFSVK